MTPWWIRHPDDNDNPTPAEPPDEPNASEPSEPPAEAVTAVAGDPVGDLEPFVDNGEADEGEEPAEAGAAAAAAGTERSGRRRRRGRRRGGRGAALGTEAAGAEGAGEEEVEVEAEEAPPPPVRQAARPAESVVSATVEQLVREIAGVMAPPSRQESADERKIALFCDLENIALGVRDSEVKKFDIQLVLERLLEKGKIIVKRAYADWERYSEFKLPFHEAAIEMIDIPQRRYTGKNSADIKMVVDAMDLCYAKEHLDTFVLLSGDSDFSPLVSKLKENNKSVIGVGVKNSSSALLIDNCDEFLYYEDIWRDQAKAPQLDGLPKKKAEVFELLIDSILALMRENKEILWGSMVKETMKRKKPSFNEGYYGYSTFSELLEDAEKSAILKLRKDRRSGTYVVEGFAGRR